MPGGSLAGTYPGSIGAANVQRPLMSGGTVGGGQQIDGGDIVVISTFANITSGGTPVVRRLLAADKVRHYSEGAVVCGVYGVAQMPGLSNNAGNFIAPAALGGIASGGQVNFPYSGPGLYSNVDPATSRGYFPVYAFDNLSYFSFALDATNVILPTSLAPGAAVGVIITASGSSLVYTIDTAPNPADAIFRVVGWDPNTSTSLTGNVFVQPFQNFNQFLNGNPPYTTN